MPTHRKKIDLRKMGSLLESIVDQWDDVPTFWQEHQRTAKKLGLTTLATLCRRAEAACVKNRTYDLNWYGLYRQLVSRETPSPTAWKPLPEEKAWPAWRQALKVIATVVPQCDGVRDIYDDEAKCAQIESTIEDRRVLAAWRKARASHLGIHKTYGRVSDYVEHEFMFVCPCCGEEKNYDNLV
jgi:hypothetical protein